MCFQNSFVVIRVDLLNGSGESDHDILVGRAGMLSPLVDQFAQLVGEVVHSAPCSRANIRFLICGSNSPKILKTWNVTSNSLLVSKGSLGRVVGCGGSRKVEDVVFRTLRFFGTRLADFNTGALAFFAGRLRCDLGRGFFGPGLAGSLKSCGPSKSGSSWSFIVGFLRLEFYRIDDGTNDAHRHRVVIASNRVF